MGGVPEHDQIPQPVDQTQCGHNDRQIIPQQTCGTKGIKEVDYLVYFALCWATALLSYIVYVLSEA